MTSRRAGVLGLFVGFVIWPFIFALIFAATKTPGPISSPPAQVSDTPTPAPNTATPAPGPLSKITEAFAEIQKGCATFGVGCLQTIARELTPATAYGAVLGLLGLLIQLWWRREWPPGQLNEGRPKVLDPGTLVTVTVAAMVAGISAAPFFAGYMGALGVITFGYFAADAAALGVDKISELTPQAKAFIQRRIAAK
jgi:hypothetical protein